MELKLTASEAAVLFSACLAFADDLKGMRSRTAAMSQLAEELKEKEQLCYELSQRIAGLTEE